MFYVPEEIKYNDFHRIRNINIISDINKNQIIKLFNFCFSNILHSKCREKINVKTRFLMVLFSIYKAIFSVF